jgi:hypothetical protein
LEGIEDKMELTRKTLAITDKLKTLEAQKEAWKDGLRFA